jgi:hypothetical protein
MRSRFYTENVNFMHMCPFVFLKFSSRCLNVTKNVALHCSAIPTSLHRSKKGININVIFVEDLKLL